MLAPYSASVVGDTEDFRRFFVFERDTISIKTLSRRMKNKAADTVLHFESLIDEKPFMKSKLQPIVNRLKMVEEKGVPGVDTAPYFIVIAEFSEISSAEHESLANVLENMWLKASALGLGFQLVSLTRQMSEDDELMELLGLPMKKFALNGCAIGYPAVTPSATPRPDSLKATQWME